MASLPLNLSTDRTVLRRLKTSDVEDVLDYASDVEWARYLPAVPQPYLREHAEEFIARTILEDWEAHPTWAIEIQGKVLGGLNLTVELEDRRARLGYGIARSHCGRGLVAEAAACVIDAAFNNLEQLIRVYATADVRNLASQRVMEKLGMSREGVHRQDRMSRGALLDSVYYAILRSEWGERT